VFVVAQLNIRHFIQENDQSYIRYSKLHTTVSSMNIWELPVVFIPVCQTFGARKMLFFYLSENGYEPLPAFVLRDYGIYEFTFFTSTVVRITWLQSWWKTFLCASSVSNRVRSESRCALRSVGCDNYTAHVCPWTSLPAPFISTQQLFEYRFVESVCE
jgi:hypothetical protein